MLKVNHILKQEYQLDVLRITPQTGGWASLAFKVEALQGVYFLKAYEKSRASTPKWTALIDEYVPVIAWLNTTALQGRIIQPVQTANRQNKCADEQCIYMLFAYIDGVTIGRARLAPGQVDQLARILAELHTFGADIPVATVHLKEELHLPFCGQVADFLNNQLVACQHDIKYVVEPYREEIMARVFQVEELASRLQASGLPYVLCHTDIHHWNLMATKRGLVLLDWEGLKLAPPEADFALLTQAPYFNRLLDIYRETHSRYIINPDTLQFYKIRRSLEDIWEFMEQLLYDGQEEKARTETLEYLKGELSSLVK